MFFKKGVLKISQELPVSESLFNTVPDLKAHKFVKRRPQYRRFSLNIVFLCRAPFFKKISEGFSLNQYKTDNIRSRSRWEISLKLILKTLKKKS